MKMISYIDWNGTMEELEKNDKAIEAAAKKHGIKYMGRMAPHNQKYHWAYFFEGDSFENWMKMAASLPRDYSKVSHQVIEYFT